MTLPKDSNAMFQPQLASYKGTCKEPKKRQCPFCWKGIIRNLPAPVQKVPVHLLSRAFCESRKAAPYTNKHNKSLVEKSLVVNTICNYHCLAKNVIRMVQTLAQGLGQPRTFRNSNNIIPEQFLKILKSINSMTQSRSNLLANMVTVPPNRQRKK